MREVYFHEDDYCQIELVAAANWDFCAQQMREIHAFAEKHKASVGWTDVFVRSNNPISLAEVEIPRTVFINTVSAIMPRFDRVLTSYSSHATECQTTMAFGPHESCVLFAEFNPSDIASAVWFTFDLSSAEDAEISLQLCRGLSVWPVAIADWGWLALLSPTDVQALTGYFDQRIEVFGKDHY